jgi:hypothetical protein
MNYNHNDIKNMMGKTDKLVEYHSKWPIYNLNNFQKKSLWIKFQNKILELQNNEILKPISDDDIYEYFLKNPDIDFEILFFKDVMPKQYIFKINDQIYSYTFGYKSKRRYFVRFYFDLNEFFKY